MPFEVEVKYRVASLAVVREALGSLGATIAPAVEVADLYLAHPGRDFAMTDEALRVRRVSDQNFVTYKGPKRAGPTKTREEIEVECAPGPAAFDDLERLFGRLGFRTVALVNKQRSLAALGWSGQTMTIALDDAGRLGQFVEVETMAVDDSALAAARGAVLELAKALHLTEIEPRSYLRMLLESRRDAAQPG